MSPSTSSRNCSLEQRETKGLPRVKQGSGGEGVLVLELAMKVMMVVGGWGGESGIESHKDKNALYCCRA